MKKKKKKFVAGTVFGLLPNYIVETKFCVAIQCIVLQRFRLGGYRKVYCNTLVCIAKKKVRRQSLYCRLVKAGCITIQ